MYVYTSMTSKLLILKSLILFILKTHAIAFTHIYVSTNTVVILNKNCELSLKLFHILGEGTPVPFLAFYCKLTVLTFGCFPSVCFILADVSEPKS
jgi:hypothetical protein